MFFALALTVIASTLVQVPRSLVNLEKSEVEALARRCVRVARAKMGHLWEESHNVQSTFSESKCRQERTETLTVLVVIAYLFVPLPRLLGLKLIS